MTSTATIPCADMVLGTAKSVRGERAWGLRMLEQSEVS